MLGSLIYPGASGSFTTTSEVFTSLSGASRVVRESVFAEGIGSQAGSTLRFYGAEKGIRAAGQTANGDVITGAYLVEQRGNLTGHRFAVFGDATDAVTLPTTGTQTYRGEVIGYAGPGSSTSSDLSGVFIGTVTMTIDFSQPVGGVSAHLEISQFLDNSRPSPPFAIDFTADSLAGGQLSSRSLDVTGLVSTAMPGTFRGQLYGPGAPTVGGVFSATVNGITVKGSLLATK